MEQLNLAMENYEYKKLNHLGVSFHLNKDIHIPKTEEVIDINFDKLEEEISKITSTNKGLMYDWHLYWSKKPHNVTDLVLKSFLQDKGTLLDPFMGYGTTIIEALRQNRDIHPIGVEINELPVKTLNTILRKSDLVRLQTFLSQVKSELKDELEKYYSVLCSECRDSGSLLKIEYDYKDGVNIPKILQYHCPSCGRTYRRDISNEEVNIQMAINEELKTLPDESMKLLPNSRIAVKNGMYNSPKSTIKGECLLIFRKRKKSITKEKKTGDSEIELRTLAKKILSAKGGEASTSEIVNSGLIEGLYKRGELHKLSTKYRDIPSCLEDVCIYNKDKNTWALKPKSTLKFKDRNLEFYLDDSLSLLDEFGENEFDACITDPPYNISGYDHKKEIGWLKSNGYWAEQKKFTKISEDWDKFSNKDYVKFTRDWIQKIIRVVKENGNIIIFGSMHNIFTIGGILNELEIKIVNSIIWYKRNAFPNITHRMFCESTEYIIWAVNNNPKKAKNWTFNYNAMKELNNGKQMRNVWDILLTPSREKKHGKHPAQKPLEVVKRLVLGCTNPQDNIIDPFMGVGSIPLVADIYERGCTGIEKNEGYLKIAMERIKDKEYYKKCIGC